VAVQGDLLVLRARGRRTVPDRLRACGVYLVSRYFGLRAFGTLYGIAFAWAAAAGAVGPVLLGRAFDTTGSYESLLPKLALLVVGVALLMLTLPRYDLRTHAQSVAAGVE
jgi:hypothetical protein